jgi:solute carrier family 15 oligopeptide transporter 1
MITSQAASEILKRVDSFTYTSQSVPVHRLSFTSRVSLYKYDSQAIVPLDAEVEPVNSFATTKSKFPVGVVFIMLSELFERFSHYAINTILILYLTNYHGLSEDNSTGLYHVFATLCFFKSIVGAIVADAYIGQYKTIVIFSVVYCVGELIVLVVAIESLFKPNLPITLIGLLLVAMGTGCVSSCVPAFGANQFSNDQQHYVTPYFSVYFFVYNIGATLGIVITPMLRNDVKCFNKDCWAAAVGLPTVLIILSFFAFLIGTRAYTTEEPVKENVMKKFLSCVFCGLREKLKHFRDADKKRHWLDYASQKYDASFIDDVRSMLKILYVFIPAPLFWALYEQQYTRWVIQGKNESPILIPLLGSFFFLPFLSRENGHLH